MCEILARAMSVDASPSPAYDFFSDLGLQLPERTDFVATVSAGYKALVSVCFVQCKPILTACGAREFDFHIGALPPYSKPMILPPVQSRANRMSCSTVTIETKRFFIEGTVRAG